RRFGPASRGDVRGRHPGNCRGWHYRVTDPTAEPGCISQRDPALARRSGACAANGRSSLPASARPLHAAGPNCRTRRSLPLGCSREVLVLSHTELLLRLVLPCVTPLSESERGWG